MKQRVKLAQALVHDPRCSCSTSPRTASTRPAATRCSTWCAASAPTSASRSLWSVHLLGEIERVCDYLVAIDAGRLLRAAPLGTFTRDTGTLAVEVDEGSDRLAAALRSAGAEVGTDGRHVLVALTDRTYDLVRDAIVELDLALVRLEPRRSRLEDLFRDAPPTDDSRERAA